VIGDDRTGAARKREHLEEDIRAAAVELTPEELLDIERAASQIAVQGARRPEHLERMIGL